MESPRVSRLDLIDSRHSEAIELFKSNVTRFNSFKHLGSNESIQVVSINEGSDSFNSLEDLVVKKEDGINNLWETWNIAHRSVLTSLKEKDSVMQKIVKEKDALAALKLTILEEKIALKDKQIEKMEEKLEEKQIMTKEKEQSNEPKCSTPIKEIFKNPASTKSRIIGLKSSKENLVLSKNLDQTKVPKKSVNNDETLNAFRRNNLTPAINQSSFQVDEEECGIMENKPIYQIQEETMMDDVFAEDTGHISDAFDDDLDGFEDEPVYENIRPGRLSIISCIPPRNTDKENQAQGRFSNFSSISYKNTEKENQAQGRFSNISSISDKENQAQGRLSNISSISYKNTNNENKARGMLPNISSISYKNTEKENKVIGRFFNNSSILHRNTEKENRVPEILSNISSIPQRNGENDVSWKLPNMNTDKENEVFRCRMEPECNYSGHRIEKHISTVHREHLAEIMNMANENKIFI